MGAKHIKNSPEEQTELRAAGRPTPTTRSALISLVWGLSYTHSKLEGFSARKIPGATDFFMTFLRSFNEAEDSPFKTVLLTIN